MGGFIDYIDCPKCGNEAHDELNTNTGEEFINCTHCGYHRSFSITNYDERENSTSEFEWIPKFELREYTPYGIYKVRAKGSIAYEFGAFANIDGSAAFVDQVNERLDELEHAEYSYFDHDTGILEKFIIKQESETIQDELQREGLLNNTDDGIQE
jgi:hypothetical protein